MSSNLWCISWESRGVGHPSETYYRRSSSITPHPPPRRYPISRRCPASPISRGRAPLHSTMMPRRVGHGLKGGRGAPGNDRGLPPRDHISFTLSHLLPKHTLSSVLFAHPHPLSLLFPCSPLFPALKKSLSLVPGLSPFPPSLHTKHPVFTSSSLLLFFLLSVASWSHFSHHSLPRHSRLQRFFFFLSFFPHFASILASQTPRRRFLEFYLVCDAICRHWTHSVFCMHACRTLLFHKDLVPHTFDNDEFLTEAPICPYSSSFYPFASTIYNYY